MARRIEGLRPGPGGIWQIDVTVNGERVQRSAGTVNRAEAMQLRDKIRSEMWARAHLGARPAIPIEQAVQEYLQWKTLQGSKSIRITTSRLKLFLKHLAGKPIAGITRALVTDTITANLHGRELGTMNRYTAAISALLHYAEERGWIDRAPKMSWFKEAPGRISYLTHDEAQRLIEACNSAHLRAMIRFALATGMRRSNITWLKWENVDLDRCVAWVMPEDAKSGRLITIPLNEDAVRVLRGQEGQHDAYVFTWNGQPVVRSNAHSWRKMLARAKIRPDFRFHDLRHTWASWHVMTGTPLPVLQNLGGWSDPKMVARYAHLFPEYLASFAGNATLTKSAELQNKYSETSVNQPVSVSRH